VFERIAIVGAMENEIGFLRKAMNPPDHTRNRVAIGTIGSKTVVMLRTGIGLENATRRLRELPAEPAPQCIVSIGCAGALRADLRIGDVVIADRIVDDTAPATAHAPSPELILAARESCKRLGLPCRSGTIVSAAGVVSTPESKAALALSHDALSVDMETARIAAWADEQRVPMLSIRVISDTAAHSIPKAASGLVDRRGRLRLRKVPGLFFPRPGLLLEILQLKRNMDGSLHTLGAVVMEMVPHL
jgi:nucleoside phosphorylase